MNQGSWRRDIVVGMIGWAVMCTVGPVVIQHREMTPITLQTLVLFFFSILGGPRVGAIVSVGYMICAWSGLPVGAGYMVVKGYLHIGFFFGLIIAAILLGSLAQTDFFTRSWTQILLWLLGHAVVLCIGVMGMSRFHPDAWKQLNYLMPGALVKSALGALLVQAFRKLIDARNKKSIQL
jgi:biotin transporter BioY